jgi:hypothetical protein
LHAPRSRQAQKLGLVEAVRGDDRGDRRLALGERASLNRRRVSTFSMRSSASAFLMSTPASAPRPTPTMIDMGVASPNAQGQAMISTATAATRA